MDVNDHTTVSQTPVFSDISERNNDYSDTLDFRRGWVGEVGVVTFFNLKVPDYESAMLIYLYIYTVMDKSKWTAEKK